MNKAEIRFLIQDHMPKRLMLKARAVRAEIARVLTWDLLTQKD